VQPYYTDAHVTLFHGDALELLPQLADGSAAAVVTDPPYVVAAASARGLVRGWADLMNTAVCLPPDWRQLCFS
jgi:DNA modification methylase